jgi:predicted metal-dependent RNase
MVVNVSTCKISGQIVHALPVTDVAVARLDFGLKLGQLWKPHSHLLQDIKWRRRVHRQMKHHIKFQRSNTTSSNTTELPQNPDRRRRILRQCSEDMIMEAKFVYLL